MCIRDRVHRVLKPGGTFLICNESNGDTDKDKKWTEIIGGMTIYKDAELKTYLAVSYTHLLLDKRKPNKEYFEQIVHSLGIEDKLESLPLSLIHILI